MIDSTENRATRRSKARRAKTTALTGAAVAAMTLGLALPGGVPTANADINVTWDPFYTAGALAGLLNLVGDAVPGLSLGNAETSYNSGPPQNVFLSVDSGIGLIGKLNLTLLLKYINNGSSVDNLYNTLGAIPLPTCSGGYASNCRYALELATAEATLNLVEAYRTQIASVTTGQTPAGYIPFEASPASTAAKPSQSNQLLGFLQNPLRPNGGIYSRFPDWAKAFGINPEMPAAGKYKSADGKIALDTSTLDVTWAYDPTADFPAVFNALAITNSLWAALPINVATGTETKLVISDGAGQELTTTQLGLHVAQLLQISLASILGAPPDGKPFYITIASNALPILTPVRLPGIGVNALLSAVNSPYLLGNPFADAIEPALKVLINTAYTDVLPPDKLNQCATGCQPGGTPKTWAELGYQAYDRTYLTGGVQTPFGSVEPLTPEEKQAVPGDAWAAFTAGVQAQLDKPFWGILVPNPDNPPAPVAATPAATVAAAAATSAPVVTSAPLADSIAVEPVSAPAAPQAPVPVAAPVESPAAPVAAPADPAPEVQVAAPAAEPDPAFDLSDVDVPAQADAPSPAPAPAATRHRGGGSDNSDNSSGASKGHRGAA